MNKVISFHLYNDYSGSPRVLYIILNALLDKGYHIYLITSKGGILDQIKHNNLTRTCTYSYHFSTNKIITLIRYISIQIYTFIIAFRFLFCKHVVFYINTILPIGPAIAGKLMRKKIIYHYHEHAYAKGRIYRILAFFMQKIADEIICVSNYQASFLKRKNNITIVPNALPTAFTLQLTPDPIKAIKYQRVLMLSSLKSYKGVKEFIQLAEQLPQFNFTLVINDNEKKIREYLENESLYKITNKLHNITIHARQANTAKFYNSASLVLNLSNKKYFIETFGLTVLEAMTAGLPVIVPTVGGVAELVESGVNGYKIDVENFEELVNKTNEILTNKSLYMKLASNALLLSQHYSINVAINKVSSCISRQYIQ